jgi:peptidoglycan/xylan/chitin deacetylase (PgdA/CDA1 family)
LPEFFGEAHSGAVTDPISWARALYGIRNREKKILQPALQIMATVNYGALVISLDFELHWGVRHTLSADGPYRSNLLGARVAVPRMLDMFEEFGIAVTWATVGFLFARSRQELEECSPRVRPEYTNPRLDPYREAIGADEAADPLHYASSLIAEIGRRPRQELGTHTFSHFYCQESGQTEDAFRQDLKSAIKIAARHGVRLRSIVFPRNQYAAGYARVLRELGITSYRGVERHWIYEGSSMDRQRILPRRGARLLDNYLELSADSVTRWRDVPQPDGLCNIPSSRILRPYDKRLAFLEPLRLKRILDVLGKAARTNGIFHLNWHPHNFGVNLEENLRVLRSILECYSRQQDSYGMRSLAMQDVVEAVKGKSVHACA